MSDAGSVLPLRSSVAASEEKACVGGEAALPVKFESGHTRERICAGGSRSCQVDRPLARTAMVTWRS